ncbi:hypothetical protein JK229_18940 [Pantoea dispersa]|uniref:hypothetical protein n=1 Tax=Pantoea dispersa TaxID=59814 RepID=UPI001BA4C826|nr:hypothetical protein [Pantoea dispersa]MBS0907197.1 hypothetical protein [Pantoea dispersa]WEA06420.1 hypothetical protein PWF83_03100 [Pantoea dispersa]
MSDFLTNLIMSLVTGGYMGIVVSKAVAFSNLKKEALRIIRTIDTLGPTGNYFHNTERVNELPLLGSELLGLKHQEAGRRLMSIFNAIHKEIYAPSEEASVRSKILEESQVSVRKLKPSKKTLFNPFDFSL